MAIGREPEPVEDRWLERTESKAVSAEARIDSGANARTRGGLAHRRSGDRAQGIPVYG